MDDLTEWIIFIVVLSVLFGVMGFGFLWILAGLEIVRFTVENWFYLSILIGLIIMIKKV